MILVVFLIILIFFHMRKMCSCKLWISSNTASNQQNQNKPRFIYCQNLNPSHYATLPPTRGDDGWNMPWLQHGLKFSLSFHRTSFQTLTVPLRWKKGLPERFLQWLGVILTGYPRDSILLNAFTDEGIKIFVTLAADTQVGKNSCHKSWFHIRIVILILGHIL